MKHINKAYNLKVKYYSTITGKTIFIRPGDLITFSHKPKFWFKSDHVARVINVWGKLVVVVNGLMISLNDILYSYHDIDVITLKRSLSAGQQYDLSRQLSNTVFDHSELPDFKISDYKLLIKVNKNELQKVTRGVTPEVKNNK